MGRLHIFDMDGTLLRGTTANIEVAKQHGSTRELADLAVLAKTGAGSRPERSTPKGFRRRCESCGTG